jgi:hypothetical protein
MNQPKAITDGNAWEASVKRWLHLKHPNDFQPVPATDGGDGGIEGYCISERTVYQCYRPLEYLDTKTLCEKQKAKLRDDIGKFMTNQVKLVRILPDAFKVLRYDYVVPELRSSDVVAYANAKAKAVRAANLTYVDPDFAIMVRDRDYFAPQIAEDQARLLAKLRLDVAEVPPEQVQDWATGHNEGVRNLDRKIRLYTSLTRPHEVQRKREYWIEAKIRAENALEKLRERSEEIWEKLWGVKQSRERLLDRQFGEAPGRGGQVPAISKQVATDMIGRVPNLEPVDAETLADGLVGEWLQNCKLDFPEKEGNDENAARPTKRDREGFHIPSST